MFVSAFCFVLKKSDTNFAQIYNKFKVENDNFISHKSQKHMIFLTNTFNAHILIKSSCLAKGQLQLQS